MLNFEWDPAKAQGNERKHGVSFDEAITVFGDPLSITRTDPLHSAAEEERFVTLGTSASGRLLVIAHADINDHVRIISARRATRREQEDYEEG